MKLQDYLHYYLGCKIVKDSDALDYPTIKGIEGDRVMVSQYRYKTPNCDGVFTRPEMYHFSGFVKPILRRLEDMTEKEAREFLKHAKPHAEYIFHNEHAVCWQYQGSKSEIWFLFGPPAGFHFLLSHHFDLFGLIDAGLAVDAKTVKP